MCKPAFDYIIASIQNQWHCTNAMLCNTLILHGIDIFGTEHDDVIKWKHFPRYYTSRSPVNSPHKDQWRRALMFSVICVWINDWVRNREAGDLRRYRPHCDVTVMNLYRCIYFVKRMMYVIGSCVAVFGKRSDSLSKSRKIYVVSILIVVPKNNMKLNYWIAVMEFSHDTSVKGMVLSYFELKCCEISMPAHIRPVYKKYCILFKSVW